MLKPGHVSLAEWRAIYEGARAELDPSCLPAVAASAARFGLRFYPGGAFSVDGGKVAGARLGFARLNANELEQAVERLRQAFAQAAA